MDYSLCLTCFIDILGTKNSPFSNLLNIHEIFHSELETVNQMSSNLKRIISTFSDCAYIIYKIEQYDITSQNFSMLILLSSFAKRIHDLVRYDFLFRGGISCGDAYFDNNKNILFGPSVNEAYKLEATGRMPRLVIEKKFAERLIEFYNTSNDPQVKRFKHLIFSDENYDKRYYLNYLWGYIHSPAQFNMHYDIGRKFSEKNIKEQMHSMETDYEIIAKHNWHLNYLEKAKSIVEKNKIL
jgi:hypothetical protein